MKRKPIFNAGLSGLLVLLLLAVFTATKAAACLMDEHPSPSDGRLDLLFVGNSFSFYNNGIHTHLRAMLAAQPAPDGQAVRLKLQTISGGRLADHRQGLAQTLASRQWEWVVLQGHSQEPVNEQEAASFQDYVRAYAAAIRAAGADPLLFMTWAYRGQPEMTAQLAKAYGQAGHSSNALVVPVGEGFARYLQRPNAVDLVTADDKHPTLAGSYLAASMFYSLLLGQPLDSSAYTAGLDAAVAEQLSQSAWQALAGPTGLEAGCQAK